MLSLHRLPLRKTNCPLHPLSQRTTSLDLGGDAGLGVGDLDTELLGAGNDLNSLSRRNGVGDLGGEGLVVHEEKLNIADVVDEESLVAGWHHVASLLVGTETDLDGACQPSFPRILPSPIVLPQLRKNMAG